MNDTATAKTDKIERAIDKDVTRELTVYGAAGGLAIAPKSMSEVMEFAKMMSVSGIMIRPAFRNNPGACLGICMQSFRWAMDPYAVVNKAYVVKNKAGEEQIAYEAQLVHAVVNTRAPLKGRLKPKYEGAGPTRKCIVTGTLKGETEPSVYESPELAKIGVKNSPLWAADSDQQLHYYSVRAWARRHVPEVLLGIYTPDEIEAQEEHYGPDHAKDITPVAGRPSRAQFEPSTEPPVDMYELVDHTGEVECRAAPDLWIKELLAASAPTVDGTLTRQSIDYLVNNAEAFQHIAPLVKDDALISAMQARYAAAEEQRQVSEGEESGAAGDGAQSTPPAAPSPSPESAASPPMPPAADAAGEAKTPASPAVAPQDAPKATPAPERPAPVQPAQAQEKPRVATPSEQKPEGPQPIDLPMSAKTGKVDSAAYLIAIQKEMTEAASAPEHIDMILAREGYLGPRKYAPGSNLSRVLAGTQGSIEMFAIRRKLSLGG